MNEPTDIISRMEAAQQRFGRLQLEDRADWTQGGDPPALAGESEADYNERTGRYDEHMVEGTLSNFDRYIAGDR